MYYDQSMKWAMFHRTACWIQNLFVVKSPPCIWTQRYNISLSYFLGVCCQLQNLLFFAQIYSLRALHLGHKSKHRKVGPWLIVPTSNSELHNAWMEYTKSLQRVLHKISWDLWGKSGCSKVPFEEVMAIVLHCISSILLTATTPARDILFKKTESHF